MDVVDIKKNESVYKDFELMDSFKVVIYSLLGIFIFFIPIKINGYTNNIIYHLYFFIKEEYIQLLKIYITIMVITGVILPIVKQKDKYCDVFLKIKKGTRLISILFIFIIFSKTEYRGYTNDSVLFMQEIVLQSSVLILISSIFMPLLTEYGLLEVVEAYCHKYTKKTFKISGKGVLNIMVYLFVDVFSGLFMTNLLYKKGKLRQNEACIIASCFSFMSIINCLYISDELKLTSKIITVVMAGILSLIVNYFVCRMYPLKNKKKSYMCKTSYKESNFKKDKFKNAIRKYMASKEKKKITTYILENFRESFNIIMTILPNLVIIIFVGEFLINNTGLIDTISHILYPFIELLKLPNKEQLSEFICICMFNSNRYIEFINNNIADISILIIFIISIVQTISITTNMLYIDNICIPLKKRELLVIAIEKVLITLIIISLIYYLLIGYI
ncbi:hypothetical protein [Paraclostridium bifermentans]|uniref:hypothetical protein n=1 Tax=Paraclostridium bifermentans TaxID=1490 RepID=UPI00359CB8E1